MDLDDATGDGELSNGKMKTAVFPEIALCASWIRMAEVRLGLVLPGRCGPLCPTSNGEVAALRHFGPCASWHSWCFQRLFPPFLHGHLPTFFRAFS